MSHYKVSNSIFKNKDHPTLYPLSLPSFLTSQKIKVVFENVGEPLIYVYVDSVGPCVIDLGFWIIDTFQVLKVSEGLLHCDQIIFFDWTWQSRLNMQDFYNIKASPWILAKVQQLIEVLIIGIFY